MQHVVGKDHEKRQQEISVDARKHGIGDIEGAAPARHIFQIGGHAKEFADPSREIGGGALLEIRFPDQLAENVIPVEFDQGVEIENGYAQSGHHHDFVGEIVGHHAGNGSPPDDGGKETENQIAPDARDDGGNALPFAAVNPDLGDIAEKAGGKVHDGK